MSGTYALSAVQPRIASASLLERVRAELLGHGMLAHTLECGVFESDDVECVLRALSSHGIGKFRSGVYLHASLPYCLFMSKQSAPFRVGLLIDAKAAERGSAFPHDCWGRWPPNETDWNVYGRQCTPLSPDAYAAGRFKHFYEGRVANCSARHAVANGSPALCSRSMVTFVDNNRLTCFTYDWDEAIAKQRAYVRLLARRGELSRGASIHNEVRVKYGVRDIFGIYYIKCTSSATDLCYDKDVPSARSRRTEAERSLAAALALRNAVASALAAARAKHGDVREHLRQAMHEPLLEIPVLQLSSEALECQDPSGAIARERTLALASAGGESTAAHEMVLKSNFAAAFTPPPFELYV
jgi:hypothetical protein